MNDLSTIHEVLQNSLEELAEIKEKIDALNKKLWTDEYRAYLELADILDYAKKQKEEIKNRIRQFNRKSFKYSYGEPFIYKNKRFEFANVIHDDDMKIKSILIRHENGYDSPLSLEVSLNEFYYLVGVKK